LPTAAELREVCFGWESLAKGFSDGGIVINLGIADPLGCARLPESPTPI
jgi:hypothetical protein